MKRIWWVVGLVAVLAMATLLFGCKGAAGDIGPAGTPGTPGTSSGTINGVITGSLNKAPLTGATVTTDPVIQGVTIASSSDGSYSAQLPIGTYKITFAKTDFTSATATVTLVAGQTVTNNVALKPTSAVKVNAGAAQNSAPGATLTLKATATPYDGSTVTGYKWSQTSGVKATLTGADSDTITVTLNDAKSYKDALTAELKPLDRFTVQAINPFAMEEATTTTFQASVTTSTGTYKGTVNVVVSLPYVVNGGLSNVPVGLPVLVHSKTSLSYKWVLTSPTGSNSTLDSDNSQNPSFTPDVVGKYTIKDKATGLVTLDIYAGTWAGAITGQDAKGRPLADGCTVCHNGKIAPDQFTAWRASGHSEILTNNINDPAGHWSLACAGCHSVGNNPGVSNGGFSAAIATEGWTAPAHGDPANWTNMLKNDPKSASLANIQCENCHGPNNSPLHANGKVDAARVTLSAELCGACHGEPTRHGRFQQWQLSGHGNYSVAISESTSASCVRCHTAQGFLLWLDQGGADLTASIQGAKGNATTAELAAMGISPDTALPQTCAACHDPHDVGTTTGDPTNAKVRIMGDTPMLPAGFKATDVGKGAICITCHNSRTTEHNNIVNGVVASYGGPHRSAQGDVLMGENAYLVSTPSRSPHASITDACVTCHMEKTPPPVEFSNAGGGTNHEFGASLTICAECHSASLDGAALQAGYQAKIDALSAKMGSYLLSKLGTQAYVKDRTAHTYNGASYSTTSDAFAISKSNIVSISSIELRGLGFTITLKTPVTVTYSPAGETPHTQSLTVLTVGLGDITTDGKTAAVVGSNTVIPLTDPLVKAGWNFVLITLDTSKGIHNPAFTTAVLDASMAALK